MLNFFFLQWSKKYKINTPLDAVFTHRIWLIILHLNPGIDFLLFADNGKCMKFNLSATGNLLSRRCSNTWLRMDLSDTATSGQLSAWIYIWQHRQWRKYSQKLLCIYIFPQGTFPRFIRNTVIIKPGITVNIKKVEISKTEI